jgi:hypothetical protein
MPKKPVSIEVVQEGDERFLVKTYADGETVRESIVKLLDGSGTQTAPIGVGISIRPGRRGSESLLSDCLAGQVRRTSDAGW